MSKDIRDRILMFTKFEQLDIISFVSIADSLKNKCWIMIKEKLLLWATNAVCSQLSSIRGMCQLHKHAGCMKIV